MGAATYSKNDAVKAITSKGEIISVSKVGYAQETAYVDEGGKTYLQNAVTLELNETDLDKDSVQEPVVKESGGVIMSAMPNEDAKPKRPDPKAKK